MVHCQINTQHQNISWRADNSKSPEFISQPVFVCTFSSLVPRRLRSCTSDLDVAKGFMNGCGGKKTLLTVHAKRACSHEPNCNVFCHRFVYKKCWILYIVFTSKNLCRQHILKRRFLVHPPIIYAISLTRVSLCHRHLDDHFLLARKGEPPRPRCAVESRFIALHVSNVMTDFDLCRVLSFFVNQLCMLMDCVFALFYAGDI